MCIGIIIRYLVDIYTAIFQVVMMILIVKYFRTNFVLAIFVLLFMMEQVGLSLSN